jgi:hypothetical protein
MSSSLRRAQLQANAAQGARASEGASHAGRRSAAANSSPSCAAIWRAHASLWTRSGRSKRLAYKDWNTVLTKDRTPWFGCWLASSASGLRPQICSCTRYCHQLAGSKSGRSLCRPHWLGGRKRQEATGKRTRQGWQCPRSTRHDPTGLAVPHGPKEERSCAMVSIGDHETRGARKTMIVAHAICRSQRFLQRVMSHRHFGSLSARISSL